MSEILDTNLSLVFKMPAENQSLTPIHISSPAMAGGFWMTTIVISRVIALLKGVTTWLQLQLPNLFFGHLYTGFFFKLDFSINRRSPPCRCKPPKKNMALRMHIHDVA